MLRSAAEPSSLFTRLFLDISVTLLIKLIVMSTTKNFTHVLPNSIQYPIAEPIVLYHRFFQALQKFILIILFYDLKVTLTLIITLHLTLL